MGWFGRSKPLAKPLTAGQSAALTAAVAACRATGNFRQCSVDEGGSACAFRDGDVIRWAVLAPGNVKVADGIESGNSTMRIAAE